MIQIKNLTVTYPNFKLKIAYPAPLNTLQEGHCAITDYIVNYGNKF
jgi:hypothetical protein